jgi:hypothetical protein
MGIQEMGLKVCPCFVGGRFLSPFAAGEIVESCLVDDGICGVDDGYGGEWIAAGVSVVDRIIILTMSVSKGIDGS